MFPSEDALLPDQLPLEQLKHVILIDSKWWAPSSTHNYMTLPLLWGGPGPARGGGPCTCAVWVIIQGEDGGNSSDGVTATGPL